MRQLEQKMSNFIETTVSAFAGPSLLVEGTLSEVALAVHAFKVREPASSVHVFMDRTGLTIDFDTRGTPTEILQRLKSHPLAKSSSDDVERSPETHLDGTKRLPGRPKLGVVSREVTLLPRHWEWLATQQGGASVALRKLVDAARQANTETDRTRMAHEAAYRFLQAVAGDLPNYEEVLRALFANNLMRFNELMQDWPTDFKHYANKLAQPSSQESF